MKKLVLACLLGASSMVLISDVTVAAQRSPPTKYCRNNAYDPICMDSKMMKMRAKMMSMTKDKVMENRMKFCREHSSDSDPICEPKMMRSTVGY
jgi:cellobiose-specific phosphotransferase system component IIB